MEEILERDSVLINLNSIQRLIYKYVHEKTLKEFNVHPGQIPILFLLKKKPGQSQKEIAKTINVEPGTIAIMLRRMEKSGLVRRVQDEKDRRVLRVFITDKADELIKKLRRIVSDVEEIFLSNFTQEEKEKLNELLRKAKKNLLGKVQDKHCDTEMYTDKGA
ncbi:MAG: MarR family winged helix-turn-helix transcriptional regulator [Fervidobacterium sp.]|uniref:MarR family winged helix-turn-helix transcriptional regulator n=1 Tax=Fervidobacterium sp. TaxID=1871331 RepID=UPI004049CFC9